MLGGSSLGKVKSETISKCFRKAGILQHDTMDVVMHAQDDDEDPFIVSDECMELQYLIEKTIPSEKSCSVTEYLHSEEEIPVCVDIDGDDWDANFLAQLGGDVGEQEFDEDDDVGEDPTPNVKSFADAIKALDDVKLFLESRG